ncbi:transcription repressor OFP7-like [Gastrolobium bilobum]|uniref:transcription repressor OFP7-like n=1 Tax=Gastrolobium bilobum TaxID=150636 RepID=UPI002AB0C041|nr:transcription repressor OFP7-like [Gastrolobium bilobum]
MQYSCSPRNMAKRFKLKFTIPSFQMCRSKNLSSFPGNPVPAIYRLSPVKTKARDVLYPKLPAPPPSTPEDHCKVKSRGRKSTSSVQSRRSDFLIDNLNEEESETLISCMTSFSDEFCHDEMVHYPHKPEKELVSRHRRKISSVKTVQRTRFHHTLENRKGQEMAQVKKRTVMSTRSIMEGKVKECFAVVKKSKEPYEDFKKSMLEMITEMEMSEAEDLEHLLQCFLSLNSRSYHAVIVRAFMEIWQQMFIWNPSSIKNLQTDVKTGLEAA